MDGLLESRGLDPRGSYVAFILRPWPGFEDKLAVFAAAADDAYNRHGLTPVFFPIERQLDVEAGRKAAALVTVPHHILESTGSSAHTIGMLSRMRVVVSMRLHGLVFAAGQGVPLVGVVYDQKVSSFLSYIGQDLFTQLESLTEEGLKAQLDAACARMSDQEFLAGGVERLRLAEEENSKAAARLLEP
ncbi:hypothetical protein SDC9_112497 [bioreactor metagenome]|uniref:Polysaccharide pyruvyl transferase domain-containing protein n=1 Tax=bioreactor metagenome TaxID=1076179 RepID=A0A645BJF1_9ZZZZ